MSVEILRQGTPPISHITTTCRRCDTEFRFDRGDAVWMEDCRDGDFYKINCPVCHREVRGML